MFCQTSARSIVYLTIYILIHIQNTTSTAPVVVTPTKSFSSADPQWQQSSFFRAGNGAIISTLTGNNTTPTFSFTFSSALPGTTPNIAYGIKNYRSNDYLSQEFFQIRRTGLTATTFSISMQIYGVTNLWLVKVAYLAADPTFPYHLNTFDNLAINNTGGNIVNITTFQSKLGYYFKYVNYTKQAETLTRNKFQLPLSINSIVLFMTSLYIQGTYGTAPNYNPIQLSITTGIVNTSFYWWNATQKTQAVITILKFSQIIFNTRDIQSSNQYYVVYQTWANDMNGGFISVPQAFIDTFIMGVISFETIDASCGFEYQWEFANQTVNRVATFGVQLVQSWTITDTCGFSFSVSSIVYMESWVCLPHSWRRLQPRSNSPVSQAC